MVLCSYIDPIYTTCNHTATANNNEFQIRRRWPSYTVPTVEHKLLELPQKEAPPSLFPSIRHQPLAEAGAPPGTAPSHAQLGSLVQRVGGAPPERRGSSLLESISPVQRELPQEQPPPMLNWAAPRSGSSPKNAPLPCSIGQAPRTAGTPPGTVPSHAQSISPAQRELLRPYQTLPPSHAQSISPAQRNLPQDLPGKAPSHAQLGSLVQRVGASPERGSSLLEAPSINQPRAAGAPPKTAPSHAQLGISPAQRKLPQEQLMPPSSLNCVAPCSGSSPHNTPRRAPPSLNQSAPRSGSSPRNS